MATVSTSADFPAFDNGDRMTRAEFHRVYEKMPDDFRAELVGGIVYVASPLRRRHGTHHAQLTSLLVIYQGNTPGVETADNATILLGDEGELMSTLERGLATAEHAEFVKRLTAARSSREN